MQRLHLALFNTAMATVAMSASTISAAAIAPTPVVLSGASTPAGVITASFTTPAVNAAGQVTFFASVSNGSTTTPSLFVAEPGMLQTLARVGAASPGGGGNYTGFLGGPSINSAGQVAFAATLSGSSAQGLFAGSPGSLGAVALFSTTAPGGGSYSAFGIPITFNPSGRVGYLAYTGTAQGVYSGPAGATTNLVLTGQTAPSGGIFTAVSLPAINPSGQMVFGSAISNGPHVGGIHVSNGTTTQSVGLIGAAAPGGGSYGNTFGSLLSINAAGQVVFYSTLTGTSAAHGIFTGTPGSVAAVARQGDASPAGGTYSAVSNIPVINFTGQVAFRGDLTGASSARGLFLGTPGNVQTLTLLGNASPDGVGIISSFNSINTALALNGAGQVGFTVALSGDGVTTANDNALLAGTPGNLTVVVREGDVIDVDPTAGFDLRTVSAISFASASGGEDGRNVTFTENGIIAYRLTFTDSSGGVFTSTIPEPTLLGLLATGLIPLLGRRRR